VGEGLKSGDRHTRKNLSDGVPVCASGASQTRYLLTVAFPNLSLSQADAILTETEGLGGGFLDNGSAFGLYSCLNLYAAGRKAMTLASSK
jgi:hypothetical protein